MNNAPATHLPDLLTVYHKAPPGVAAAIFERIMRTFNMTREQVKEAYRAKYGFNPD